MGIFKSLFGGGSTSTGGGFFGSGGKTNSGNTTTTNRTTNSNFDLANSDSAIVSSLGNVSDSTVTMTDHGAIGSAMNFVESIGVTLDGVVNDTLDIVSMSNNDMKSLSEFSIMEMSENAESVELIASESMSNNAYLTESVINTSENLASGFGGDLAYLTDSSLTSNSMLVDKVIDTASMLTENHQLALDDMGMKLADNAAQHSSDLGFLTGQAIQGNNELTSQYMQSVEWLSTQTTDALQNFGIWTEGALDSALEVAGNVALDDSVEGLQNIFKYLSVAAGVVGVAYVVKGAFK